MHKKHKIFLPMLFTTFFFTFCLLEVQIDKAVLKMLVIFSSMVLLFHSIFLVALHVSHYKKLLHQSIDEKEGKRGVHIIRDYFESFVLLCVSSCMSSILFAAMLPIRYEALHIFLSSASLSLTILNAFSVLLIAKVFTNSLIVTSAPHLHIKKEKNHE